MMVKTTILTKAYIHSTWLVGKNLVGWGHASKKLGGGGFKYFFIFTPNFGEDEPHFTHIFQRG